ncbi:MAG: 3-oxoacyl-[acyl-carrier-protein] reductase [Candidatus Omnitrophota bacterium]
MKFLQGKVALVTGGSRGIGKAIVLMLAHQGCDVAFSFQKSKDAALVLEKEIKSCGVRGKASCVDVTDFDQVKIWIEETKNKFGQLDILINNAGILADKALMMMEQKDWQSVIDTNLNGLFNVTRSCIVTFLKQKSGQVINISSVSGIVGLPRQTNYSASKGGMIAFTKALAKEVAGYGIQVNAIAPGFIETDMLKGLTQEQKTKILESIPLARIGAPEDVANCVKFLLSQQAKYITGQVVQVDGGLAIR